MPKERLLEIRDLKKYFPKSGGSIRGSRHLVYAVDGVNLGVESGECLGLVGESGCGKTTLGRCVTGLEKPTGGSIWYRGVDMSGIKGKQRKEIRSKVQVVFQDPYASLNPRWMVKDIIAEPFVVSGHRTRNEVREKVVSLLDMVGLDEDHMYRFPHEFSGGQRQRIAIARALSVSPEFIVLDEPTSSLDVSVQAQILNLLKDLQSKLDLTYLFISHNLSVIRHMATRIAVMYLGRVVELGSSEEIFRNPLHPYTKVLFDSVPVPTARKERRRSPATGDIPDPTAPPAGCHFNPRCPVAFDKCRVQYPALEELSPGHFVACFRPGVFA